MPDVPLVRAMVLSDSDPVGRPIPGTAKLASPVLEQNELWWTEDGRLVTLDEMTPSHRRNLLAWLERRAASLFLRYQLQQATGPFAPRGDAACDAFEQMQEEEFARWHKDPAGWLATTPFHRRLASLIEADLQELADAAPY